MTTRMHALAAAFALALAAPAAAQQAAPAERMNHQQERIDQGIASGDLTHHEAVNDERHLRRDERIRAQQKAKDHGGKLTGAQRARDERLLNNNSARVYDTKHSGKAPKR